MNYFNYINFIWNGEYFPFSFNWNYLYLYYYKHNTYHFFSALVIMKEREVIRNQEFE